MNAERHHDDERLITLAATDDPAIIANDLHLRTCRPCADSLATLRDVTATLSHPDVWSAPLKDTEPHMETVDLLRKKQAEGWVKKLLAAPIEEWEAILNAHPTWKCDAMVEAMVAEVDRNTFAEPQLATELARLAVALSSDSSQEQRFHALREYAYCLYYTGRYPDALVHAEFALSVAQNDVQRARMRLQVALITIDTGDRLAGLRSARAAAAVFEQYLDTERLVSARRTEALALFHLRRHREALSVNESVLSLCGEAARASLIQNIALCHRELGNFDAALELFVEALELAQSHGHSATVAKIRWHLGRTLLLTGKYDDALSTLRGVEQSFNQLSMLQDATLVSIDIAQVLWSMGKSREVGAICRSASNVFASLGMSNSEGALTALAILHDAAICGDLTDQHFVLVRREITTRTRHEHLYFD